jgi:uncharacterized glyoxalase superfamily protein PhnB
VPDDTGLPYPTISPYLYYRDGSAAMDFLVNAFGFSERMRHVDDDGTIRHAEVELDGGVVMLGCPANLETPRDLGGKVTVGIYVHVKDVDAHFERAKAAGAELQDAPTDQEYGVRSYGALDPEGHQWWFAQPLG